MGGSIMIIQSIEKLKEYVQNFKNTQGYCVDLENGIKIFENEVDICTFPLEIVFLAGNVSVTIRYLNGKWYADETEIDFSKIEKTDINEFYLKKNLKYKKAEFIQIWEDVEDKFCENMKAAKLKKVVFAGFKE
jgi:CRISPR type III-associated protein (TIGR04423 family)